MRLRPAALPRPFRGHIAESALHDAGRRSVGVYYGVLRIEDMHHRDAADAQHIGDQRSVATPPHRFSAHKCRPSATGEFEQLAQAVGKHRAADMVGIAGKRALRQAMFGESGRGRRRPPSAGSQ
jgi:hypothetical protein